MRFCTHRAVALPWEVALDYPGSMQMGYLRKAFEMTDWWKLRPAQKMLINQPGDKDIQNFIAVSVTDDKEYAFVYTPVSQPFTLDLDGFAERTTIDKKGAKNLALFLLPEIK